MQYYVYSPLLSVSLGLSSVKLLNQVPSKKLTHPCFEVLIRYPGTLKMEA